MFGRMYFMGNDGYQNFLVFAPMLSSLTLDNHKKVTDWILIAVSPEKIKPFYTSLEKAMCNVVNNKVILMFNNSVLVQKGSSSLYITFILNLFIVYELNNWPRNPSNIFALKSCLFGTVKLVRHTIKSKFTYNGQGITFDEEGFWSFCDFWC